MLMSLAYSKSGGNPRYPKDSDDSSLLKVLALQSATLDAIRDRRYDRYRRERVYANVQ